MFSLFSGNATPHVAEVSLASAAPQSMSDLVVPSIRALIDPERSPVAVAKQLIDAASNSAGGVAADVAVPDGIETIARFVGADGLLAKYGPGRAAAAVAQPLVEKLLSTPIIKGCMAVLESYSSLISLTISGITALQFGVAAAAGLATGYALYRFFTQPAKEAAKDASPEPEKSLFVSAGHRTLLPTQPA
jgi:hypothetical protein